MANQLQLRKGSASPIAAATVITNALEAEPFFNTTDGGLYVAKATGSAGFAFIGGGDTIAPNTSSTGAELKLRDGGASDYISIRGSSAMTATYSAVMPAAIGSATQFLELNSIVNGEVKEISALTAGGSGYSTGPATNVATTTGGAGTGLTVDIIVDAAGAVVAAYINNPGSGYAATDSITISGGGGNATFTVDKVGDSAVLAWGSPAGGFSNFTVDDGTATSDVINSGDALTITGGDGITSTLTGNNTAAPTITLDLDINGLTADTIADADALAFYDADGTDNNKITAANLALYVLQEATGDVTFDGSGVATIAADSVALGTQTTGNYVEDVTAGNGLTKTSSAGEGQTVDLAVGAGEGIAVTGTTVDFKNAANLTDTRILKWNDTSSQLENSSITDDGTDVIITGSTNLTVGGNLTVSGTTTTVNTQNVLVEDQNIVLGNVGSPDNTTANGGGITLNGGTDGDKTITWVQGTAAWTLSEHLDLAINKEYRMNGTAVLDYDGSGNLILDNVIVDGGTY